ncbi:MAG: hypothetical protein KKG59_05475 [Nanoarchaeota archaeon]|nr:hypothetical protein [Nanoarchaeota archaeon]
MSKKIAIVDDNERVVKQFKQTAIEGRIISAHTFMDFKRNLLPQHAQVCVWLLDRKMPLDEGEVDIDLGDDLVESLKKVCPQTPRICISTKAYDPGDRAKMRDMYQGFANKFEPEEIIRIIAPFL